MMRFDALTKVSTIALVFSLGFSSHAIALTQVHPDRWVLLYAGGPSKATTYPRYTVEQDLRYVAVMDTAGRPQAWLTSGAIVLSIYGFDGRSFATWAAGKWPALGNDWEAYVDTLLSTGGVLNRLDSAVAVGEQSLGVRSAPYKVTLMVPYPDSSRGSLTYLGTTYDLSRLADRINLVQAYVSGVRNRFAQRGFRHLALTGFYWLHEEIGGSDSTLVATLAKRIHEQGIAFMWIPYFNAPGYSAWRAFGFDQAWIQPNYFFHPTVALRQMDAAIGLARATGMGLELEFDLRLFTDSAFAGRLDPYLAALEGAADLRARPVALFEGHGGLLQLVASHKPSDRALYQRLVSDLTK